jgi:hypothetical protein
MGGHFNYLIVSNIEQKNFYNDFDLWTYFNDLVVLGLKLLKK